MTINYKVYHSSLDLLPLYPYSVALLFLIRRHRLYSFLSPNVVDYDVLDMGFNTM